MALTKVTGGVVSTTTNLTVGVITATKFVGPLGVGVTGDGANFSGIVTATGLDINGNADISGNLSVGGTVTYQDVTNVDSVGVGTFQSNVQVGAGISVVGVSTFNDAIGIGDSIIHLGNTDTSIRFPADDTITAETAGSERLRIDAAGNLSLGRSAASSTQYGRNFQIHDTGTSGATLHLTTSDTGTANSDGFHLVQQGAHIYHWLRETGDQVLATGGTERLRIDSNGNTTFGDGSFLPGGSVNIINSKNVETGVDNAANYHLVLKNSANDTGEAIGLAFGITDTAAKVGAAILHERDGAGSEGSMQFLTRPDNAGPPVERLRIASDGYVGINTTVMSNAERFAVRLANDEMFELRSDAQELFQVWKEGSTEECRLNVKHGGSTKIHLRGNGNSYINGGKLLIGTTSNREIAGGHATLQVEKNSSEGISLTRTTNDAGAIFLSLGKVRTGGSNSGRCVADDNIGSISWNPSDGTDLNHAAAEIQAHVASGIGGNDVPGHLIFKTNGGTTTTTERLRITSSGIIGISGNRDQVAPTAYDELTDTNNASIIIGSSGITTAGIMFRTGTTGAGRLYFGDNSGNDAGRKQGFIEYHNDGDFMRFGANGAEALRITSTGTVLKGLTTARGNYANNASGVEYGFQIEATSATKSSLSLIRSSNDVNDGGIFIGKTRSGSVGGNTAVQGGDDLGTITFGGADGTTLQFGAEIIAQARDGVGNDDMPTDLIFKTNGGSTNTVERLRITDTGEVGIGITNPTKTGIQNNVKVLQIDGGDGGELILGNSVSANVSTNHIGAIAFKNIDTSTGSAPHYAGIRANCTDTSGNMNLKFYAGGADGTGFEDDTPDMLLDSVGRLHTGYTSSFGSDRINILASDGGGISIATNNAGDASNGDILGSLSFQAYLSGQAHTAAEAKISGIAAENHSGSSAATDLAFYTKATSTGPGSAPAERMRIYSGGGINVDSSHYVITSSGKATTGINIDGVSGNADEYGGGISFQCGATGAAAIAGLQGGADADNVGLAFFTHNSGTGADDALEIMRIQSNGDLFIGTKTSPSGSQRGVTIAGVPTGNPVFIRTSSSHYTGGGYSHWYIYDDHGKVGWVNSDGDGTASYNSASDYRLKENVVDITDGIEKVKQLKPYRFNFKTADSSKVVQGFFAHEVSSVVPNAVDGDKDGVAAEDNNDTGHKKGDPIYQGLDTAKMVPILTAALKESIDKIETLEARIAALESS